MAQAACEDDTLGPKGKPCALIARYRTVYMQENNPPPKSAGLGSAPSPPVPTRLTTAVEAKSPSEDDA
jgi:hypothetical protein